MTTQPLRSIEHGSGPGFCYDADRRLFRSNAADGPLVIALDSNIVADTMEHGTSMLDDEPYKGAVDPRYAEQLDAWAQIIELWLVRDIRFITLPGMRQDQRNHLSAEQATEKDRRLRGIEDALTFQIYDFGTEHKRFDHPALIDAETQESVRAALSALDATLVLEAAAHQVDVFLTRDKKVVNRMSEAALPALPAVMRPTDLLAAVKALGLIDGSDGMAMFTAGHVEHDRCAYAGGMPAGDIGKWVPLMQAIEDTRLS